jgi:hypothetical protein
VATGWALLATACLLWPGFATTHPDDSLPAGFEGERLEFELLVLSPLTLVLLIACTFHVIGARDARSSG